MKRMWVSFALLSVLWFALLSSISSEGRDVLTAEAFHYDLFYGPKKIGASTVSFKKARYEDKVGLALLLNSGWKWTKHSYTESLQTVFSSDLKETLYFKYSYVEDESSTTAVGTVRFEEKSGRRLRLLEERVEKSESEPVHRVMTLAHPPVPPLAVPFYLSLTHDLYRYEFDRENRISLEAIEPVSGYLAPLVVKYAGKEFVFLGDEPVYARRFKVMGLRHRFEFWVAASTEDEVVLQVRFGDRKMVLSAEDYTRFTEKVKTAKMKKLQEKLKRETEEKLPQPQKKGKEGEKAGGEEKEERETAAFRKSAFYK